MTDLRDLSDEELLERLPYCGPEGVLIDAELARRLADLREQRDGPAGAVVIPAETVAEIKESRAVALKYASDSDYEIQWMNNRAGFAEACDWFLSLLGVKEEK